MAFANIFCTFPKIVGVLRRKSRILYYENRGYCITKSRIFYYDDCGFFISMIADSSLRKVFSIAYRGIIMHLCSQSAVSVAPFTYNLRTIHGRYTEDIRTIILFILYDRNTFWLMLFHLLILIRSAAN